MRTPMEETLREIEKRDGVRMTWNVWPIQKTEYTKQAVPIACLYSPRRDAVQLSYEPVFCQAPACRAILNPYCTVNFQTQDWCCAFCRKRNLLPAHYKDITPSDLVPELVEENTTVEYLLNREVPLPPVFFIILDTCFFDEERRRLAVDTVRSVFSALPEDALVGLVAFGTNIELYDLSSTKVRITYSFSGKKEYTAESLARLAGTKRKEGGVVNRFLMRKSDCSALFHEILEEVRCDPFPVMTGCRQVRCTGSALSFASAVLGSAFQDTAVKYFLFTQGPCTFGPGTVAAVSLSESIRSYTDILRDKALYCKSASAFYARLGKAISSQGHSVDILAATLYDVGIYEMRPLVEATGGLVVMAQDFNRDVYLSSCLKSVQSTGGAMDVVFNAKMHVQTTPNLKFKGCLGMGAEFGQGWRVNSVYREHNATLLFDTEGDVKSKELGHIQIVTQYQRSDRRLVTRVTTLARLFSDLKSDVLSGFDQEAAMVLLARMFTSKKEAEEEIDLIRRIDRVLVRFLKRYASYQQDYPSSVALPFSMSYFPNFVFFFRRSLLVLSEAISPDEGAYHRNLLSREAVTESMTMIVPTLIAYHYQGQVEPVEMDVKSLDPEKILLFDTFHNIVVWRGRDVARWIKEKLHEQEEYKFLKELVECVEARAREIVAARLPTPQYTVCDQDGSQERLLLSRLNPSTRGQVITDDIDFNTFYTCLCKLIVTSN